MHRRFSLLAMVLSGAWFVAGQVRSSEAAKTGGNTGVVVDSQTGEPVRKTAVIVRRDRDSGTAATSDAAGKFELRDLEPGSYTVSIERSGFVAAPDTEHKILTVKAAEVTSDVKLALVPTGAISGRVVDPDGDPVPNANVQAAPHRKVKAASPRGLWGTTNDRGEYRIFNAPPGDYTVWATPATRFEGMRIRVQGPSGDAAWPSVYYAGTKESHLAGAVKVAPGVEVHGIDLQLSRAHAVRVRGRVLQPPGSQPGLFTMVGLDPVRAGSGQRRDSNLLGPGGEFEMTNVLPGMYRLAASSSGLDGANPLGAQRIIKVSTVDIDNLELTLGSPQKLNGRVLVPEGRKLPAGLIVVLFSSTSPGDMQNGGMAQIGADGSFVMDRVPPGDFDVVMGSTVPGENDLYIGAIRLGDVDALAEGIHVGDRAPGSLDIVLKPNGGAVDCLVTDAKDAPVAEAQVMLVPDGAGPRRTALFGDCTTDATGACAITGIAPGDYHAYAFPPDAGIDHRDPESLQPYDKLSQALKVAEGRRQPLAMKLISLE